MTDEELKNKCTERAKIFQQAMESCHSSRPMDCIEWFADRIAELEAENQKWKDEWQEQVQKATDEGYARTLQTIQLTKAKDLLAKWVELFKPKLEGYPITPIQEQTEQFIKNSEVEK